MTLVCGVTFVYESRMMHASLMCRTVLCGSILCIHSYLHIQTHIRMCIRHDIFMFICPIQIWMSAYHVVLCGGILRIHSYSHIHMHIGMTHVRRTPPQLRRAYWRRVWCMPRNPEVSQCAVRFRVLQCVAVFWVFQPARIPHPHPKTTLVHSSVYYLHINAWIHIQIHIHLQSIFFCNHTRQYLSINARKYLSINTFIHE